MSGAVAVGYPVVAITDVHGRRRSLERLLDRLARRHDWSRSAVVFCGDYVDRGDDVRGTIDLVLGLARSHPAGVSAVMGNHDRAVVRAAGLDGGPRSAYWVPRYRDSYDHAETFRAYLGRDPRWSHWDDDLAALRDAMPAGHRDFLAGLPWLVEAPGHLFLHCGLSPALAATADGQLDALRARRWDRSLGPKPGTATDLLWQDDYPVWLGADRSLSARPLPAEGRVQVTGHLPVAAPEVNGVRIRFDTSGGLREPLTACVLTAPGAAPEFVRSDGKVP